MYSENVTEIIDDLMFDERCLDREEMKREGIRLLLEANLSAASSGNRHYCKPFYSGKPMDVAREYYDPDASEEDVIGFYDNTLFGKGTEGVLFCADGMFVRELWSDPRFIPYNEIISGRIEATRKKLVLPLSGGREKEIFMIGNREAMGRMIRQIVELYKRLEDRTHSEE